MNDSVAVWGSAAVWNLTTTSKHKLRCYLPTSIETCKKIYNSSSIFQFCVNKKYQET